MKIFNPKGTLNRYLVSGIICAICLMTTLHSKAQLTVSYTYWVSSPRVNFIVTSSGGMGKISYSWNYVGAGTTYPYYVNYASPGKYYVCVTATDTALNTAVFCDSVLVPCKASFSNSNVLLQVQFQNKSFNSGSNYSWNFGDGSPTSSVISPSHTYSSAGTFNVCLTVVDSLTNCSSTFCDSIVAISSYQCSASFSHSNVSVGAGLVEFINTSTNNYPINNYWDFGDGNTGKIPVQNYTHSYSNDGRYQACLTIRDTQNLCTSTYCDSVIISGGPANYWDVYVSVLLDSSNLNDSIRVYLIKEDTNFNSPYLVAVDSADVFSNWIQFENVREGTYYLKSSLRSVAQNYKSYLPTYYKRQILWNNATSINVNSIKTLQIKMIKGINPGGPGFISGFVSLGANLVPGDPIPGLDVLLLDVADNPIAHIITDSIGKYKFNNLAYGTYKIFVDILNIPATPLYVTLDKDNPSSTNNQLEVNSTGVGAPITTGVKIQSQQNNWFVYPNPSKDIINLQIEVEKSENIQIRIFNITGELVMNEDHDLVSGSNLRSINFNDKPRGLYFIILQSNTISSTIKVVIE